MREEDLVMQAARLRLLCKCLALTKPEESGKWLDEARFFDSYVRDNERYVPDEERTALEPGRKVA